MTPKLRPVSELCLLAVDCVNKTAPTVEYETQYKMIRTTNVKGGFIDLDNVKYVTEATFEKWTRRSRPRFGDVILTREAPVGEVGRFTSNDERVFLGQRLFHYRPNPELLDWNYLAYALQSHEVQGRLRGMGFGATVDHVKVGDAENLLIPWRPVDVQQRIGSLLAAHDDLIENNRRRMALLEQSARLLYRQWFVHHRFPGHERVGVTKGVPEGWEWKPIGSIAECVGGGTPSTSIDAYWDEGDITWVTPTDVTRNDHFVLLDSEKKITSVGLHNSSAKLVPAHAVLMTSRASVGYFAVADREVCTNQGFISIVPHEPPLSAYLLFHLSERVEEIRTIGSGSTYPEVSRGKFREFRVLIPSNGAVVDFAERAGVLLRQIRLLKRENEKLRATRDLLLPRLISGEIEV